MAGGDEGIRESFHVHEGERHRNASHGAWRADCDRSARPSATTIQPNHPAICSAAKLQEWKRRTSASATSRQEDQAVADELLREQIPAIGKRRVLRSRTGTAGAEKWSSPLEY